MFRVKMTERNGTFNHEAYFTMLPTKEDVLKSIERDRKIAGEEFNFLYDIFKEAAEDFRWPQTWMPSLAESGSKANDKIYVKIKKINVINNRYRFTDYLII